MSNLPLIIGGSILTAVALYAARSWGAIAPNTGLPVDPRPSQSDVTGHPHSEPMAPRPGVEAFRGHVLATWGGRDDGIWGDAAHLSEAQSEHNVGTAWDWGQPDDATAHKVIDLLLADGDAWARRLGVGYVIFQRQMYRVYAPERGWTAYTGPDPHTGHVHFSFSRAGAMGQTSGYQHLDMFV